MGLHSLNIHNFRNLQAAQLEPTQGLNYIQGKNGSGKTSLLEAIYYLSLARSFRGTIAPRVIHYEADKLSLFAQVSSENSQTHAIGLERHHNGELKLRVSGQDVHSIAELAHFLPVQLMDSHCHALLDGGPHFRRKYVDWSLFYLNAEFFRVWQHFTHALKQRNAALRRQLPPRELAPWTQKLAESADLLCQLRKEMVAQLLPRIATMVEQLLPISGFVLSYEPGWNAKETYLEHLAFSLERDRKLGYTQAGPHKADLKITINNIPAKDILSRGQQKLFVCAMILARGALLQSRANEKLIYLVDDLPAELDATSRSSLIALLSKQAAQLFVTATENTCWDDFLTSSSVKMFHVEHGKVTAC